MRPRLARLAPHIGAGARPDDAARARGAPTEVTLRFADGELRVLAPPLYPALERVTVELRMRGALRCVFCAPKSNALTQTKQRAEDAPDALRRRVKRVVESAQAGANVLARVLAAAQAECAVWHAQEEAEREAREAYEASIAPVINFNFDFNRFIKFLNSFIFWFGFGLVLFLFKRFCFCFF